MEYKIKDVNLWESGVTKIDWVKGHMDLLNAIEKQFIEDQPFKGIKIALSSHIEAKTAYLCMVLASGGADMYIAGSNPLTTQDDVAAALVHYGFRVFSKHGASEDEYKEELCSVLEYGPNIILDDGGDLVNLIHSKYPHLIKNIYGGCEQTTSGIMNLFQMDEKGELKFPMMLVNNAQCKHLFDNRYGTGQSVLTAISATTNLIIAGKNVVIAGYGWCGKGAAMRAKGLGAKVIVTEVNPVKALEATMDGFSVMKMDEAASIGDIFITVTACIEVITKRHFEKMKDGAICCNAGHSNIEVDMPAIEKLAVEKKVMRKNIMGYKMPNGRWVCVLAEGRLVNLASGDGHPAEIMDMSYAIEALSVRYVVEHYREFTEKVVRIPKEIDFQVASLKLKTLGYQIDELTDKQSLYFNKAYLGEE